MAQTLNERAQVVADRMRANRDALGVEVLRLVRVSIGPLRLGELAKGAFRHLSAEEKLALDQAMANARLSKTS